jgi:hypothetical protein
MLSKKPFSTTNLAFGQKIFKADSEVINETDARFGRNIKTTHSQASVLHAVIEGLRLSDCKRKLILDIKKVNIEGDVLNPNDITSNYDVVEVPLDQENVMFGDNVWSDDLERVRAQCNKTNSEALAGLKELRDIIDSKMELIEAAAKISSRE